jgi:hypothetical protein
LSGRMDKQTVIKSHSQLDRLHRHPMRVGPRDTIGRGQFRRQQDQTGLGRQNLCSDRIEYRGQSERVGLLGKQVVHPLARDVDPRNGPRQDFRVAPRLASVNHRKARQASSRFAFWASKVGAPYHRSFHCRGAPFHSVLADDLMRRKVFHGIDGEAPRDSHSLQTFPLQRPAKLTRHCRTASHSLSRRQR